MKSSQTKSGHTGSTGFEGHKKSSLLSNCLVSQQLVELSAKHVCHVLHCLSTCYKVQASQAGKKVSSKDFILACSFGKVPIPDRF